MESNTVRMIKAVIVEDELRSRQTLENLLRDFCKNVEVVAAADSISSGLDAIYAHKPDLLFLDIEMHYETGFDLLEKVKTIDFDVIFTTAYENYALKAIKYAAVDYLLKPIDIQELREAVEKVEKKKDKEKFSKNFEVLMQNMRNQNGEQHQIAVSSLEGIMFIKVNEILYCEADGPYTKIYQKNGEKILSSRNLKEYEELLTEHRFFRIHNSYLINLNEVKKYLRGDGGSVVLTNGSMVDVSKRKKEDFLLKLYKN